MLQLRNAQKDIINYNWSEALETTPCPLLNKEGVY
jgi:hypothetical protein